MSGSELADALKIPRQREYQLGRQHPQFGLPVSIVDRLLDAFPNEIAALGLDFETLVRGEKQCGGGGL